MRTMGIAAGDAVLVIEHRGEQEIVYNALVAGMSMRTDLVGPMGEPAIEALFVVDNVSAVEFGRTHATLALPGVVHITHRDWVERRASLGYEELPGPTPGVCRYCHCTERRECAGGCSWLYPERTVCSSQDCQEKWVRDNKLRVAAGQASA